MQQTIVIIDDDLNVLDAVTVILKEAGYIVRGFTDCKDIFETIRLYKPDLILLDLLLEDQDGREICKSLKSNLETSSIPVIVISGAADIYNTINKEQANDVIEKPFTKETLLARIERQLVN